MRRVAMSTIIMYSLCSGIQGCPFQGAECLFTLQIQTKYECLKGLKTEDAVPFRKLYRPGNSHDYVYTSQ